MTIKRVLLELKLAVQNTDSVLINREDFKVLVKFKKQLLKKVGNSIKTSLQIVLSRKIIYKEILKEKLLTEFENTEIAVNQIHSVEAIEDSLCLLIHG